MTEITVAPYTHHNFELWQNFIANSDNGTIFHRLDFLAYHGERFQAQTHHLMWYEGPNLFGVMPMAILQQGTARIVASPYGASYGGPVFRAPLNYVDSRKVVRSMLDYCLQLDVTECRMTLPIPCYHAKYSETFRFALLEQGFRCVNRDISSVACLNQQMPLSAELTSRLSNVARKARKARNAGVVTKHRAALPDFWIVMDKTFRKHGTKPTHTMQEFEWLCDRLSDVIYVDVAYLDGVPIAGIGHFIVTNRVICSFYLCQDPDFQQTQAQSLLLHDSLIRSMENGFDWFDFGTSSTNMVGKENIFRFKESLGAIGLFRDTYIWEQPE